MLSRLSKEMAKNDDGGLGEMLKGKKMEKVMVASDSKEGLAEGLDKAQEILKKREGMPMGKHEMEGCEMSDEDMPEESEEMEDEEEVEETPEEIQAQIAALQAKLAKK